MGSLRLIISFMAVTSAAAFAPSVRQWPSTFRSPSQLFSDNDNSNEFDDFAEFSSAQLTSDDETLTNSSRDGSDGDSFLSSLQSRVQQVEDQSNKLPLMILDTMLPRQILQIQIQHPTLKALMKYRVSQETPTLGMLGMAQISTGQSVPLKTGVEVQIVQMDKATDKPTTQEFSDNPEEPWDISLRAGRRFIIEGDVTKTSEGWTEANVKFLDSATEEDNEVQQFARPSMDDPSGLSTAGDRLSVARAISQSKQFTEPNMNMRNNASLIDRWIELAKQNERHEGQIDELLGQLGEIPPEYEPTERALWVGALINPLPSMGVAMEIRPALLVSKKAEDKVKVALEGILKSIRHMDGSAGM